MTYLAPYLRAAAKEANLFKALLWSSPDSQALRFAALVRHCPMAGLNILDAGCGRADLLDYLLAAKIIPAHYTGLEAVPQFLAAAHAKQYAGFRNALIIDADFIQNPALMLVGADAIIL